MKRFTDCALASVTAVLITAIALEAPLGAQTIGMVADDTTNSVTVFNADTDTVIGSVALPNTGSAVGDCSITSDQTLGFVTDFNFQVHVIDLSGPALAGGTNPIIPGFPFWPWHGRSIHPRCPEDHVFSC